MSEIVPTALLARDNYAPADATAPDRALAPVRSLLRRISLAAIAVMIILPALQVLLREVLDRPFVGAEELTRFMLISLVFMTFPYVVASGANIRLDEALHLMPAALRRGVTMLIAVTAGLTLAVAAASVAVATLRNLQNATPTLGIPYWVFFSASFVGLFLAAVECLLQFWKAMTRRPLFVAFADEASPDDMAALEAALAADAGRAAAPGKEEGR
jgi:TRAP-type C4-dicarboxylate transport system permease small subunit